MINYMLFHWEKESKVEKISGGKFYLANLLEFSSLVAKQAVENKLLGPTWYNRTFQSRISFFTWCFDAVYNTFGSGFKKYLLS